MRHGKKYRAAAEKISKDKVYSLEEAVKLMKENKIAKFDESVEVHIKTNVDTKKGDQQVRGTVVLPHGTGKTKRVAVITSTSADEAKAAGADIVGGEELIATIATKGTIDFDVAVATPAMMPKLAKLARLLGPRGLMPNPKTDTVSPNVTKMITEQKAGKESFKNDPQGNLHQ
ncbi:MAG: 50S ribosomal protein L1, partial [Candidatus Moranbacteria bacterium]|nr:50S ribosomal protein L1 [Candidatus Moranbacteria bacterium]